MKRLFSSILMAYLLSFSLKAQLFEEKRCYVTVGYGFPNFGRLLKEIELRGVDNANVNKDVNTRGLGPLHAKVEYALNRRWGLGLNLNLTHTYATWKREVQTFDPITGSATIQNLDYKENIWNYALNIRANYHFLMGGRIDPYWGIGIGYRGRYDKTTTNDPNPDPNLMHIGFERLLIPIGFDTGLGFRYFFTENLAMYLEAGLNKSLLQGGLVYKL